MTDIFRVFACVRTSIPQYSVLLLSICIYLSISYLNYLFTYLSNCLFPLNIHLSIYVCLLVHVHIFLNSFINVSPIYISTLCSVNVDNEQLKIKEPTSVVIAVRSVSLKALTPRPHFRKQTLDRTKNRD